jgi:hypothetical protein
MLSQTKVEKGNEDIIKIIMPKVNLRPGVYNLYYWLGDQYNKPYDVVDGLTAPLEIKTNPNVVYDNYNPNRACGYFDLESIICQ